MCKYCEHGTMLAAIYTGNGSQEIYCYIEKENLGGEVYLTLERHNKTKSNYFAKQMIQFCPMCGRRLNEKEDFSGILEDKLVEYSVKEGQLYFTCNSPKRGKEVIKRKAINGME